jgi:branched-chain amino acid transport system permease protein
MEFFIERLTTFMPGIPQLVWDGLWLGFVYALIALGYTMVYGVLELVNFAHSEIFMIGAVVGVEVFRYMSGPAASNPWWVLLLALLLAAIIAGGVALLVERFAYRPIRARGGTNRLVPLITTIGVSFILQDLVRLIEALWHNEFNLTFTSAPVFERILFSYPANADFPLFTVSFKSLIVMVVATLMLVGLLYLVNRTKLGLAMRAVAQDMKTASLMGINPNTIIARTFFIGGALGGVAGVLWAMMFPNITAYVGFVPGLKAFTAAVLGGIGNLSGAMVGGLVLGQLETFFGGGVLPHFTSVCSNAGQTVSNCSATVVTYIGGEYKDVIAFVVLILLLFFRPQGLLGQQVSEKV